mgnify:CR=1 FL=1
MNHIKTEEMAVAEAVSSRESRLQRSVNRVREAIDQIRAGGIILVRDDEGRENEGDMTASAELITAATVNFMVTHARGMVCQPITAEAARRLELPPQAPINTESHGTAFTVTVDAAEGITTGISAADRARTIRLVADPQTEPKALRRPGHMFPLVAKDGGVFERRGHTEATVDLMRLAGLTPSGVICEVLTEDGTMARGPELEALSRSRELPLISVDDLIAYRDAVGDFTVEPSPKAALPTELGPFTIQVYRTGEPGGRELTLLESPGRRKSRPGESNGDNVPLIRLHSECLTGDAFHSERCDCGSQLNAAMERIAEEGGAVVYLRQEGRGIGLFEKVRAYELQDNGLDTLEANLTLGHGGDERRYGAAAAVLKAAGYRRVRLLTNNPEKVAAIETAGIEVTDRIPLHVGATEANSFYLSTKFERMGHLAPEEYVATGENSHEQYHENS